MDEEMNVDFEELHKQYKEDVLRNGRYISIQVTIPTVMSDEELRNVLPICEVDVNNTNPPTVALAALILERMAESLVSDHDAKEDYDTIKEEIKNIKLVKTIVEEDEDDE